MHSQEKYRESKDIWWENTINSLIETYNLAWLCSQSTLLSPMMLKDGQIVGTLMIEKDNSDRFKEIMKEGTKVKIHVNYLDSVPEEWKTNLYCKS